MRSAVCCSPPAVTEADAGKFLRVSSTGEWVAEKPTYTASDVGAAAESHDHNLQDLSGTVPLSKGGTGANNASDALANLGAFRFLGNNVITSTNNDTPSNWVALGSGYAFFSDEGVLTDQPSHWGIVVSFVTGSDIFQMWRVQTSGPTYWRGGNASGWSGTWVKVYDTAEEFLQEYDSERQQAAPVAAAQSNEPLGMGSLFTSAITEQLLSIDVMSMTPIEAMNMLYKLQAEARKEIGR